MCILVLCCIHQTPDLALDLRRAAAIPSPTPTPHSTHPPPLHLHDVCGALFSQGLTEVGLLTKLYLPTQPHPPTPIHLHVVAGALHYPAMT